MEDAKAVRNIRIYASTLLFLIVFGYACSTASAQEGQKWERYTGKGEAFTALFPERPSAVTTYRPVRFFDARKAEQYRGTLYNAYSDGVVYLIYSFPRRSEPLQKFVDEFMDRYASSIQLISGRDVTLGATSGQRDTIKFRDVDGVLDFYITDNRAYVLEIVGADETNASVKRFLDSFTIGGAPDSAAIEIKPDMNKSSQADEQQDTGPVFTTKEVTRKAILVLRREPQYTEEAREAHLSGNVVIKAVLSSSGKVTNIEVTKSLSHGLTEKAIEAARQIIFIPAMKDGRFVSQSIQAEYNFSVY
ncbi:MAG TPA: energy transducer TonB [Pyrinomonadaceae bacterium]|nr:energy transducer TonB [Pyrinomonadaceae bacterium]